MFLGVCFIVRVSFGVVIMQKNSEVHREGVSYIRDVPTRVCTHSNA